MASMTITVPDAAVPFIQAVCIADGWDGVNPPTLAAYIDTFVKNYYIKRITELKAVEESAKIQAAIKTAREDAIRTMGM